MQAYYQAHKAEIAARKRAYRAMGKHKLEFRVRRPILDHTLPKAKVPYTPYRREH